MRQKGIQYDNAAQRKSYVGYVYQSGAEAIKEQVLDRMPLSWAALHREGKIHIHDLEAYGQTYNCLQLDVLQGFPYQRLMAYSDLRKITEIFLHYRNVIAKLGNEQSGGIGFPNFDTEVELLFERLGIEPSAFHMAVLKDSIESFVDWLNVARERLGQVTYYVSLNLGLGTGEIARFSTRCLIEYFRDSSLEIIKPNIIFKVKKGVNYLPDDPNYDLLQLAMGSTCRKMIPTYLLFDSKPNATYDPKMVGIMGCRTKVVGNIFGEDRSVGRANIDCISINLPRIALEIDRDHPDLNVRKKVDMFKTRWTETADDVKSILLDRYHRLLEMEPEDFPANYEFNLWLDDFKTNTLEDIFVQGTHSIGFIGLSEVIEVFTGEKFFTSDENHSLALEIVQHMRAVVDGYKKDLHQNFTLLASSGEYISGRFPEIDRQLFRHDILEKEFYTNSFHVDVDSVVNPLKKIAYEGPFHEYANGGCIAYVEFASAPLENIEALGEIIGAGIDHGVNYLGMNFPLDNCNQCSELGTFDSCSNCGSEDIYRIRRVSGYLEELPFFTNGKKAEVATRLPNGPR